jgi:hypothetical protein
MIQSRIGHELQKPQQFNCMFGIFRTFFYFEFFNFCLVKYVGKFGWEKYVGKFGWVCFFFNYYDIFVGKYCVRF